jgi:hypothetical protein
VLCNVGQRLGETRRPSPRPGLGSVCIAVWAHNFALPNRS